MSARDYLRRVLLDWENYQVQPVQGRKMDANESPFTLPEEVRRELADWILAQEDFNIYPDTDNTVLRQAIADYYAFGLDWITAGVGSDQLIDLLAKAFLEPGDRILVQSPSFSMYQTTAEINHGTAVSVPLLPEEDFRFSADTIIQALQEQQPKLLFICSPNNPTGCGIPKEDLIRILEAAHCVVILDEAYGEFSGADSLDLIRQWPDLISLRTFSKAYGLAGLRVGYALAHPDMIRAIDTVRAPYNLNTFSQIAAARVLGRPEYRERIQWIISERERMQQALATLEGTCGFHLFPSQSNFLFMRSEVEGLGAKLLERGLLVRAYGGAMASYIRVSISEQEANDAFIQAMKEILQA